MTKMKFLSVLMVSLLFSATTFAQSFKIMGSKGNNTVGGQPLKIGAQLSDDQTIDIAGDYLGLIYKDGRPLELRTKGSFKVKDLVGKLGKANSLANKYISLVADELSQDNSASASKSRSQHMKKTGSVTRSLGSVQVLLPTRSFVYGDKAAIRWFLKDVNANSKFKSEDIKGYTVYFTDLADAVLHTESISKDDLTVDLNSEKLKSQAMFIIKVVPVKQDGTLAEPLGNIDGNVVEKVDAETMKSIKEELATINEPGVEPSALSKLIEARFFEEKELYSDAIASYEKVLELSGGLEAYNEMYKSFLYRNNLTKESFLAVSAGNNTGNNK